MSPLLNQVLNLEWVNLGNSEVVHKICYYWHNVKLIVWFSQPVFFH